MGSRHALNQREREREKEGPTFIRQTETENESERKRERMTRRERERDLRPNIWGSKSLRLQSENQTYGSKRLQLQLYPN